MVLAVWQQSQVRGSRIRVAATAPPAAATAARNRSRPSGVIPAAENPFNWRISASARALPQDSAQPLEP